MSDLSVTSGDTAFPERLLSIPSPPSRLWIRGIPATIPSWGVPSVAVVGSRGASRDGLSSAREIADGLARAGVVVVSGLARGIDSVAHRAALDAQGCTIAVLGSGLDRLYPPEHAGLAVEIARTGAIVTEYSPDTPPHAGTFPRRNRLVSGLADAVVIVEAPEKSGALITASAALDQGKDVMVVPGRVAGGRNRGGHLLIRDGASIVETAADVLEIVSWTRSRERVATAPEGAEPLAAAGAFDSSDEFTVDDESARTGDPPSVVLARLLQLELGGQIQRVGQGRFVRVGSRVLT